jgi:phosphoglycerate kinase
MEEYGDKLIIAEDSVVAPEFKDVEGTIVDEVPEGHIGMDIGPKTIERVKQELQGAKTVI